MKPVLVIGLGNPLMGDEGVGCRVAEVLAGDPCMDVIVGGTDLLRFTDRIEGRDSVWLIDAIDDGCQPGTVSVFENDFRKLEERQASAHHLSAAQAIGLLKLITPAPFTLIVVSIQSAELGTDLSPVLASRLAEIAASVRSVIFASHAPRSATRK